MINYSNVLLCTEASINICFFGINNKDLSDLAPTAPPRSEDKKLAQFCAKDCHSIQTDLKRESLAQSILKKREEFFISFNFQEVISNSTKIKIANNRKVFTNLSRIYFQISQFAISTGALKN